MSNPFPRVPLEELEIGVVDYAVVMGMGRGKIPQPHCFRAEITAINFEADDVEILGKSVDGSPAVASERRWTYGNRVLCTWAEHEAADYKLSPEQKEYVSANY